MVAEDNNKLKNFPQITTLCKIKSCQLLKTIYSCVLQRFLYITTLYHIAKIKMKLNFIESIINKGFGIKVVLKKRLPHCTTCYHNIP